MADKCCDNFQAAVDQYLIRHKSVLDVLTKYQESTARVNRACAKAVTECGCIQVTASRQNFPNDVSYRELSDYTSSHITGELCENCKEILTTEIGHSLFYLTALCNLTELKMSDVMERELKNVNTLGVFHLT